MNTGNKVVLIVVIILAGVASLIAITRMMNRGDIGDEYIKLIREAGSSDAQNPDGLHKFNKWIAEPKNLGNFSEYRRKNNNKELEDCIRDNVDNILRKMISGSGISFGIGIRKEGDDTVILSYEKTYLNDCIKNFIASNDVRAIKKGSFAFNRVNGAANILAFGLCSHIAYFVFPNLENFDIVGPNNVIITFEELANGFVNDVLRNIMNTDGLLN